MSNTTRQRRQARLERQAMKLRALNYHHRHGGTWQLDPFEQAERDSLEARIMRARLGQAARDGAQGVQLTIGGIHA